MQYTKEEMPQTLLPLKNLENKVGECFLNKTHWPNAYLIAAGFIKTLKELQV